MFAVSGGQIFYCDRCCFSRRVLGVPGRYLFFDTSSHGLYGMSGSDIFSDNWRVFRHLLPVLSRGSSIATGKHAHTQLYGFLPSRIYHIRGWRVLHTMSSWHLPANLRDAGSRVPEVSSWQRLGGGSCGVRMYGWIYRPNPSLHYVRRRKVQVVVWSFVLHQL